MTLLPLPYTPPAAEAGVTIQVGELAERTGKSVRALRLYEELGLLEPSGRTKGRFRVYDSTAKHRVDWISKMQDLGFTLPKIKELLALQGHGGTGGVIMGEVRTVYARKLEETRDAIDRLRQLEGELVESLRYLKECSGCGSTSLPHACGHSCARPDREGAPTLIRGFSAQQKDQQ